MLKNYFKIALRSFLRHKGYTSLNVLGLAIGIASSLLILEYVTHELSYDNFHSRTEDLYRVQYNSYTSAGEKQFECATAFPGVGPALKTDFPEVEDFCRLYLRYGGGVVQIGDKAFHEDHVFQADENFFDIFSFELLEGAPGSVLANPNLAVISEETAVRYFGEEDPIGKRIRFAGNEEYEISGVARSPENSHLKFSLLFSYKTMYNFDWAGPEDDMREIMETNWGWYDFYNYIRLAPGTDPKALTEKFPAFIDKYTQEGGHERTQFELQRVKDIHLYSDLIQEARVNGNGKAVYFLMTIAFFILIIAWINYINLATARSLQRAREVGIRKVIGAQRGQLIRQFIFESLFLNVIAAVVAILLVELITPFFNQLAGVSLSLNIFSNPLFWMALAGLFLAGAFLAGLYPAFVLSSFKPITVLKGKLVQRIQGFSLRKGLVVFQFMASVGLISGTYIVYQQIAFMRNQNLGINIDQTLVLNGPGVIESDSVYSETFNVFKEELLKSPKITKVAASSEVPGNLIYWTNGARRLGSETAGSSTILYQVGIDYDFLELYGHELIAGRNFSPEYGTDKKGILLNERAIALLGFASATQALGQQIISGDTLTIIGIMANYHQESLRQDHRPIGFQLRPNSRAYFSMKLNTSQMGETLALIQEKFQARFPGNPFGYFFLDDFFDRQYQAEKTFGRVFGFFASLAILVACLGLLGLSAFSATQRTKEISIRKVLGASIPNLFLLLSKDFLKLILIANLLAIPLVWFGMTQWLEGFAFRTSIGSMVFLTAAGITLLIALATISYQALKAAKANPADTLRAE